eukprot:COSAG05_NODE_12147_length_481_cov_1.167539_1_plen_72_part_10
MPTDTWPGRPISYRDASKSDHQPAAKKPPRAAKLPHQILQHPNSQVRYSKSRARVAAASNAAVLRVQVSQVQ